MISNDKKIAERRRESVVYLFKFMKNKGLKFKTKLYFFRSGGRQNGNKSKRTMVMDFFRYFIITYKVFYRLNIWGKKYIELMKQVVH